jgi:hypothetical protein
MLFPTIDFPHKLFSVLNGRIGVGVVASAGTLFAVKLIAHPGATTAMIGRRIAFLSCHSYAFATFSIIGLVCRSLGRMLNTSLMADFDALDNPRKRNRANSVVF